MPVVTALRQLSSSLVTRSTGSTRMEFAGQWKNPSDVLSLLLIIGADIVQSALAQMTGGVIVPVCFSFGWVAYGFASVAALVGKGRLMPEPDYPCKVINVARESGHTRENKNWMVGRILRDLEMPLEEEAICVRMFDAVDGEPGHMAAGQSRVDAIWYASLLTMLAQCGIAAIPCGLYKDWGILLVTIVGTLLALLTGALPQWRVEKYAARSESTKTIALTVGNGSRHIILIKGNGNTLDFEDLASNQGPKVRRSWNKFAWFQRSIDLEDVDGKKIGVKKTPIMFRSLPIDFWVTRAISVLLAACWVALLIAVSGLKENTWFLLAVGAIGMAQNAIVATISRPSETRGVHLVQTRVMKGSKVMDVLMDVECVIPGAGRHLVREYFPAGMRDKFGEKAWWDGDRGQYDRIRLEDQKNRGVPESMKSKTFTSI